MMVCRSLYRTALFVLLLVGVLSACASKKNFAVIVYPQPLQFPPLPELFQFWPREIPAEATVEVHISPLQESHVSQIGDISQRRTVLLYPSTPGGGDCTSAANALRGMSSAQFQELYGKPAIVRYEGTTRIERYHHPDYILVAYLFGPAEGVADADFVHRARHVALIGDNAGKLAECFALPERISARRTK